MNTVALCYAARCRLVNIYSHVEVYIYIKLILGIKELIVLYVSDNRGVRFLRKVSEYSPVDRAQNPRRLVLPKTLQ
jgi:hypothetical protein